MVIFNHKICFKCPIIFHSQWVRNKADIKNINIIPQKKKNQQDYLYLNIHSIIHNQVETTQMSFKG